MGVEKGFLSEILADPFDDAPRLVYADWLEDHGDPDQAEFIRTQVRLAGMDAHDHARAELGRREWQLLRRHGKEWGKPGSRFTKRIEFVRGFVGKMTLTASKFIDAADKVFARVPLGEVRLLQAAPAIDALVGCGQLRRLRALDLHTTSLGAARTTTLAGCEHLANLRELNLGNVHCRNSGVRALLCSPHLRELRRLRLNHDSLTDPVIDDLAGCETLPNLRALDLGHNQLTSQSVAALNRIGWLEQLEELSLSENSLGDDGVPLLASSQRWVNLRKLDLSRNQIGEVSVRAVGDSPHLAGLVELRLGGATAPRALAELSRFPRLRVLDLWAGSRAEDSSVAEFVASPTAANLRELSAPPLSAEGMRTLLTAPSLSGLTTLRLAAAGREAGGAIAALLAKAAHLSRLTSLDLNWCHIGSGGMIELADSPHLAGLAELSVPSNRIGPEGFDALIRSPYLTNLRRLAVWNNPGAVRDGARRLVEHFGADVVEGVMGVM